MLNISTKNSEFILNLRSFCKDEFSVHERFFITIYGSYPNRTASEDSDLDVLVVCDNVSEERKARVFEQVERLHLKYKMPLDFDIPYDKKLVLSRDYFARACSGEGIYVNSKWTLPKIEKTPEILSSERLLLRFFIGMMTNPQIFVAGNYLDYAGFRNCAFRNVLRAIVNINNLKKVTARLLASNFCGDGDCTGELFLGFKNGEPHYSYLLEKLEITLNTLSSPVKFDSDGFVYELTDSQFLFPEVIR